MIKDHKDLLQNKRYDKCSESHKIAVDRQGNLIPLDINRKKHHCSSAKQIVYEEKIVQETYDDIERTNKLELRYILESAVSATISSHQPHVSFGSEGHYKATTIEKI